MADDSNPKSFWRWATTPPQSYAVYLVCLFGFIIWAGLIISWVFFGGVKPPLVAG